jgi:HAD superfamily phosphatase (TIGR01681 family)
MSNLYYKRKHNSKISKKRKRNKKKHNKSKNNTANVIDTFKVFVFDLDNTLYLHSANHIYSDNYHKQVKSFLENLKAQNKILCIATHNKNPKYYLERMQIFDLFDHIKLETKNVNPFTNTVDEYTGKNEMVQEIIDTIGCKKEEVIFFDDLNYNINLVENIGVKSIKVSQEKGIDFKDIKKFINFNLKF